MGSLKHYATAAGYLAIALSSSTVATAADLFAPPPPEPIYEVGGGWYLRGDIGIGIQDYGKTQITVTGPNAAFVPTTGYVGRNKELGDTAFIGAGIGYEYSSWMRFDITGEYRKSSHWSFLEEDRNFSPSGFNKTSAKHSAAVGLANVYFDLGSWHGVSAFVGGGVGVAHHMFSGIHDIGFGAFSGGFGFGAPRDTTNFAWALHAGLGYAVSPNLKLELAYRYLNMGSAHAGTVICQPPSSCNSNQFSYKLKDIESHDIKIGMRWLLGGPAYPPAPLVAKY